MGDCAGVFRIGKKGMDGAIDIIVFHPPLKPGPKRPGRDDPTKSRHCPICGPKWPFCSSYSKGQLLTKTLYHMASVWLPQS